MKEAWNLTTQHSATVGLSIGEPTVGLILILSFLVSVKDIIV